MDSSVSSPNARRESWTTDDIRKRIDRCSVVVFAKGSHDSPKCGFSERVFSVMEETGVPYELVDVSQNRSILPALTAFAGRQYLPLVFVNGSLVTNFDTLEQMIASGALIEQLKAANH